MAEKTKTGNDTQWSLIDIRRQLRDIAVRLEEKKHTEFAIELWNCANNLNGIMFNLQSLTDNTIGRY